MTTNPERSTLADVAREAGVHASTVSRALSRPHLVTPETRSRVEAAAAKLRFLPNPAARNLVQGRTGALGILVPDITNPYFAAIVSAAQSSAERTDRAVLLVDTRHDPDTETLALARLHRQVDGIIVCSPVATGAGRQDGPLVHVNRRTRGVASVTVDQSEIVGLAHDHLVALGHRRVVWINGPDAYWSSRQRAAALADLPARRGTARIVISDVEPTFVGGQAVAAEAIATGASAVVAFNDLMALGVSAAAHEMGRRVPEDLSIVGSDDVPLAAMSWPALTSVASPLTALGEAAVRSLDGPGVRHQVLHPTLSVRASTGPPAPVQP